MRNELYKRYGETTVNKEYKLQIRVLSPNSSSTALIVRVGTSAGGTQNLDTTLAVTDLDRVLY